MEKNNKKALLISYYFDPFPGVGAKRISYWANNLWKYNYDVDVISAYQPDDSEHYRLFHLPEVQKHTLSSLVKDKGLGWSKTIKSFIKSNDLPSYDFILISGGPFMHMGLGKMLKNKFPNCKLILDFRDPFANNPRFNDKGLRKWIKLYFEKKFLKYSDIVVTVNNYCSSLINNKFNQTKIIQNGFDDSILESSISTNDSSIPGRLIYTGAFYADRNPECFLKTISSTNTQFEFHHIGEQSDFLSGYRTHKNITEHGFHDYSYAINEIRKSEVGLIITKGDAFESTTKIFDYIGCGKKILIITEGKPYTGSLHQITKDYPNVFWTKNEEQQIKLALEKIKTTPLHSFNASRFSRAESLRQLITVTEL
ncbi:MAG: hypothetical protein JEZ03_03780 [Bacteroidales bacterium]|nr:hypothetical protein [Bacteroidales bacterium]